MRPLATREPAIDDRRGRPTPARPQRPRTRWQGVFAGVLAVAGCALLYFYLRPQFQSAPFYARIVEVRAGRIDQTIRLNGSTAAEHSVTLRAPYLRGRRSAGSNFSIVIEQLAAAGARVTKGEPVAKFDRLHMENRLDDYRESRADREAQVMEIKAEMDLKLAVHQQKVRAAKGKMDQAALDLKTAPVLSAIEAGILKLDFEEAQATYEALVNQTRWVRAAASADLERARLDLREEQVEERRAEANLERMVVRAPIDGLFVPGQIFHGGQFTRVRAGDQVRPGQPYAQIVETRSMIVEASVNQADVRQLRIGTPVRVGFDAYPGFKLPGRVHSIAPLATSAGRRRDYVAEVPVVIGLEAMDPRVIPQMSVSADVVLRSEPGAGIVAREAVFYPERGGQPYVRVRTQSGWQTRAVELGLWNNIAVAVRSGVRAGDVVAADSTG